MFAGRRWIRRLLATLLLVVLLILLYLKQCADPLYMPIPVIDLPKTTTDQKDQQPIIEAKVEAVNIPKIIHQTGKSHILDEKTRLRVETWTSRNPEWNYRFWTDDDIDQFVKDSYPQYYAAFSALPRMVSPSLPLYLTQASFAWQALQQNILHTT